MLVKDLLALLDPEAIVEIEKENENGSTTPFLRMKSETIFNLYDMKWLQEKELNSISVEDKLDENYNKLNPTVLIRVNLE